VIVGVDGGEIAVLDDADIAVMKIAMLWRMSNGLMEWKRRERA
jgi:hypothetical protein